MGGVAAEGLEATGELLQPAFAEVAPRSQISKSDRVLSQASAMFKLTRNGIQWCSTFNATPLTPYIYMCVLNYLLQSPLQGHWYFSRPAGTFRDQMAPFMARRQIPPNLAPSLGLVGIAQTFAMAAAQESGHGGRP